MSEQNKNMNNPRTPVPDANKDPITGRPGAHPIGTGLGAIGAGAAAGAVGGAVAGPVGAAAGAVVGAVAGAVVGRAAAEVVNPTVETKYWKENHASRLYADPKLDYDQYGPAYQYGWESFAGRKDGKSFESIEGELGRGWDHAKGTSRLVWDQARAASRDAWNRVELAARRTVSPART